jgi:hypothetical protein
MMERENKSPVELAALIEIEMREGLWEEGCVDKVKEACDNCPACTLSAVRLWSKEHLEHPVTFNFKEEMASFWKNWNAEHAYDDCCGY